MTNKENHQCYLCGRPAAVSGEAIAMASQWDEILKKRGEKPISPSEIARCLQCAMQERAEKNERSVQCRDCIRGWIARHRDTGWPSERQWSELQRALERIAPGAIAKHYLDDARRALSATPAIQESRIR